jgi:hypothetical protein
MSATLVHGDVREHYGAWPVPDVVVSDGAYGVGGFKGDPRDPRELPAWYAPHVAAWSAVATPTTSLWFWCTEIGWALVHPLLHGAGWTNGGVFFWDKGIAHAAGNTNTKTLRRFPVVTEVCARYVRSPAAPLFLPPHEPWVWQVPAVRGAERVKVGGKAFHGNQKPLVVMNRIVRAASLPGDVVWEPFGGLCTASVAAHGAGRRAYAAEVSSAFYEAARLRLGVGTSSGR